MAFMHYRYVVYPEGDIQEIPHRLRINEVVDLNGFPLNFPLQTSKIIAYRVYKISTEEGKGEEKIYHYLELMRRDELEGFVQNIR